MGGDRAPGAVVRGAADAAAAGRDVVLVGDSAVLTPLMPARAHLPVVHAAERVGMGEPATVVVRKKPDASVRRAIAEVAAGRACAAVSVGNTGAAMAAALVELGRLPGVERPAVTMVLPRTDGGQLVLLDLGANVDCKPSHLAAFAVMGDAYARAVTGVSRPRIGLLSNGEEATKGNEQVREALPLLETAAARTGLHFAGPIEPTDALRGGVDVLVCDGFVGNVMLKTVEATAEVVGHLLREEIGRNRSARVGAWMLKPAFVRFRDRIDYAAYGGALLLGVGGTVVVGHGRSDARAVAAAVHFAHRCAAADLPGRVERAVARMAPSADVQP